MRVLGFGNALLDIFSVVEDEFPASIGIHPATVAHTDLPGLADILLSLPDPVFVSGGGAANAMKIGALLGLETSFYGSLGEDRFGDIFKSDMEGAGVKSHLNAVSGKTGVSLILKTRSGLYSLAVSPGAALSLEGRDVGSEGIGWADWVYAEGFLLDREGLLLSVLNRALMAGKKIAFDLGSWRMVKENRALAVEIASRYADVVFCNEEELEALAGMAFQEAVGLYRPEGTEIVVKRGAAGALLVSGDRSVECPAERLDVVDQTGAGDAFAAGYLHALSRGSDPLARLASGNSAAAAVLAVPGTKLERD
jgi:sugar/nucleoside kinase (ribokinase family)